METDIHRFMVNFDLEIHINMFLFNFIMKIIDDMFDIEVQLKSLI